MREAQSVTGSRARVAVGILLITLFTFAGSMSAFAAPVVATVSPSQGLVITSSAMPPITALVTGGVTPMAGMMVVDGVSHPALADVSGLSLSYTPGTGARLADGVHTVSFSATDAIGAPVSKTWTFDVEIIPVMSSVVPVEGSVVADKKPSMSVIVYDNSLATTFTITVDGVRIGGVNSSGYEATWGGYYGISGYPVANLTDGTHTAYARVTDPGGHTVERTWTFIVNGEISVEATGFAEGQVFTTGRPPFHFLAKSTYSQPFLNVNIDGASAYQDQSSAYSNANHNYDVTVTPAAAYPLSDGFHQVVASAWASPALSKSLTVNIEVRVPPTVLHLRPSSDVAVTTTTPTLVARVTDNSTGTPTFDFTIDGAPVAASPVRTIATSRWEDVAQVTTPLSVNATHTATVVVHDAKGYPTTRTWQFFVAKGTRMPHYSAGACPDCHGNPYYPHAANGGDAIVFTTQYSCNLCHSVFPDHTHYGWYTKPMVPAQIDNPSTFIPNPWNPSTCSCHSSGHIYSSNLPNCLNCHDRINTINEQGEPPLGRGETTRLRSETPRHGVAGNLTSCAGCHQLDLTFEHAGRTDSTGAPITCQTCHASAVPAIQAAVSSGQTSCSACHAGADSSYKHGFAVSPVDRNTACRKCHDDSLAGTHPYHNTTANCGAACHQGWGASSLAAVPRYRDTYGAFAFVRSQDASPGLLHVIHARPQWPAKADSSASRCKSCHAAAACDACHEGPISPTHSGHASTMTSATAWVGDTARGVTGGDQAIDSHVASDTVRCAGPLCHDITGVADAAPWFLDDNSHPASPEYRYLDNTVIKTGTWRNTFSSAYAGGEEARSNNLGATLSVSFTGEQIVYVADKDPYRGIAEVLIDGVSEGRVDLYADTTVNQAEVFTSRQLLYGTHTLTVRVTGTSSTYARAKYITVDQFKVYAHVPGSVAPACGTCH